MTNLEKKLNEETKEQIQEVLKPIGIAWNRITYTRYSMEYMSAITISIDNIGKSLVNFNKTKFNYIYEQLENLINTAPSGSEFVIMDSVLRDVMDDIAKIDYEHHRKLNLINTAIENTMEEIIDMQINSLKDENGWLDEDEIPDAHDIYANLKTIKQLEYLKEMAKIKSEII